MWVLHFGETCSHPQAAADLPAYGGRGSQSDHNLTPRDCIGERFLGPYAVLLKILRNFFFVEKQNPAKENQCCLCVLSFMIL